MGFFIEEITYTQLMKQAERQHIALQQLVLEISPFITKLLQDYGTIHSELHELYFNFHQLQFELEYHIIKEETAVFTKIKLYEQTKDASSLLITLQTICELRKEFELIIDLLKELRRITNGFKPPSEVCPTYKLTYMKLEHFDKNVIEHINLEHHLLFTRFEDEVA
ncbi:hemerythrin domain-containing protein [Alkalihalobacillus sp. LMS39]|uniref:hemerythrin domain-containing protein n=1 Tax=Alkalihalobacillus sp. LMS39 TaxID=2924032 RepID=UPI001FB269F4|nr:hemerythrin domain-containing protein [Alkalihalobacillus sp. LMS39]UOE94923.1 hemerythrin domain-containing protein [Alkalihalobacillus sp. LMS39]